MSGAIGLTPPAAFAAAPNSLVDSGSGAHSEPVGKGVESSVRLCLRAARGGRGSLAALTRIQVEADGENSAPIFGPGPGAGSGHGSESLSSPRTGSRHDLMEGLTSNARHELRTPMGSGPGRARAGAGDGLERERGRGTGPGSGGGLRAGSGLHSAEVCDPPWWRGV